MLYDCLYPLAQTLAHTYLCSYRLTMNLAYRWTAIVTLAVFLFSHTMLFAKSEKKFILQKNQDKLLQKQ